MKPKISEDWLALILGLFVFVLSLANLAGIDVLGWAVSTAMWTTPLKALGPASKTYAALPALVSLLLTYLFLLALLAAGAKALNADVARFAKGFTLVFCASYFAWVIGSWAYIAATPEKRAAFGIKWSLNLTNEAGFIVALLAGLVVANFFPRLATTMKEAIRPELYVKTAIVILGGFLGITAAEQLNLATSVLFLGVSSIIAAYLIYWAVVYYVARRYFGFSREWAAPLASGISICGVSAAIATGSAIRARPVVPVMVSSLVVIFAVIELILLPFAAQTFLYHEPMVAGRMDGTGGEDGRSGRYQRRDHGSADHAPKRWPWTVSAMRQVGSWAPRRQSKCSSMFSSACGLSSWRGSGRRKSKPTTGAG